MTEDRSVRVPRAELSKFCRALLERAGATPENAAIVIDHLVEADRMGLRSHGVMRVPQYLDDIAAGGIAPAAEAKISVIAPGRAAFDGDKGFGQVIGMAMVREAVRLAQGSGISFVTGRHMGHTGRIGAYAEAMARDNCVGIAVCSGPRSGHWVAPFGGLDGRLATNPIAYAFPVQGAGPVVADFSTSVVPEGVIRSLKHRGMKAPEGALRDPAGVPTTDPEVLYATPRGAIQALGGAFGYRGTALGIFVDVLAALLADDEADDPEREGSNLAMIAISANEAFAARAEHMATYIRSSRRMNPAEPVLMPGDRELAALSAAGDAVLVDGPTWASMRARAGTEVAVPLALAMA
jgi:hydroxycarboxylate dehydrogenase B